MSWKTGYRELNNAKSQLSFWGLQRNLDFYLFLFILYWQKTKHDNSGYRKNKKNWLISA